MRCNNCKSEEFVEIHSEEYSGHKGPHNRGKTVKTVYRCKSCGKQGKGFEDGVDGTITLTGVLREK
jgi:uncharacterized protein with PIN domain